MKRLYIPILTLALALGLATNGPAETRPIPCSKQGGATVAATKHARVFKKGDRVYACRKRTGRRFLLGGDQTVHDVRIAGRFVGYSRQIPSTSARRVTVKELRRGWIIRNARAATFPPSLITDLKLKTNGSVAWIARLEQLDAIMAPPGTFVDPRPTYQVQKADPTGQTLLDQGRDVAPGSLRLRGDEISWTKAGQTYSAALD